MPFYSIFTELVLKLTFIAFNFGLSKESILDNPEVYDIIKNYHFYKENNKGLNTVHTGYSMKL